jgi:hypothetical protein
MSLTRTLEELVDVGVYEFAGYAHDGESMYSFNVEKAKIHAPEIYQAMVDGIDTGILDAIEDGYLDWEFDDNFMVSYSITNKGFAVL